MTLTVELLGREAAEAERDRLAHVLADCVAGGASISFMWPFDETAAFAWWGGVVRSVAEGGTVLLAARLDGEIVGSAQLGLDRPPNQPHRADVRKVIVQGDARGRGVGRALMEAVEAEARARGLTLLTLDTVTGSAADRLYRRLGWQETGTVPGYALWPDGRPCDATFFWKKL